MKHLFRCFALLLPLISFAQPDTLWTRIYDLPDYQWEVPATVVQTSDGGFLLIVRRGGSLMTFIGANATGDTLFTRDLDLGIEYSVPVSISSYTPNHFLLAAGWRLIVIDESATDTMSVGNQWVGATSTHNLVATDHGTVFIAGVGTDYNPYPPYYHYRGRASEFNLSGLNLWTQYIGATYIYAVAEMNDHGLVCASLADMPNLGVWVGRVDSDGMAIWNRRYMDLDENVGRVIDMVSLSDGSFLLAARPPDSLETRVRKIDSAGTTLWTRDYPGIASIDMHKANNSTLAIVGSILTPATSGDIGVVAIDQDGDSLWTWTWEEPAHNEVVIHSSLTSDGGMIVVGTQYVSGWSGPTRMFAVRLGSLLKTDPPHGMLPEKKALSVHPNPFNPSTTISFSLPHTSNVTLAVYDITGRKVETLIDKSLSAGEHSMDFNGSALPSGLYFARLTAGEFSQTQKMVLLK